MSQTALLSLLLGVVLLFLGRKLFWVFVGVAGFMLGMDIAQRYVAGPEGMKLLIAIMAGLIGALIAIFLQRVAVAIAGFIAGGYIAVELMRQFGYGANVGTQTGMVSIPYIIGGIIGAILVFILFDWALIVLSSLSGASLIVRNIPLHPPGILPLVFLGLVILGILVQAGLFYYRSRVT